MIYDDVMQQFKPGTTKLSVLALINKMICSKIYIQYLGDVARLFAIETQFIRAVPLYMARISTQETYTDFLQIGKKSNDCQHCHWRQLRVKWRIMHTLRPASIYLLRDVLVCSIAHCFYELCCIHNNTKNESITLITL